MRTKMILVYSIFLYFISCNQIPNGYSKFQTFDEYRLKGVSNKNEKLCSPFVAIKQQRDTIDVLIFEDSGFVKSLKYINKKAYWYNLTKEQTDPKLYFTTKCDTVPFFTEKYIYNDTILKYSYYMDGHGIKSNESLRFITKKNEIELSPETILFSEKTKFADLKKYLVNYISKYRYYEPKYRSSYYEYFNKALKGDTLYIYENNGKNSYKYGCLTEVLILNSLGEYQKKNNRNVLYEIKKENLCK